MKLLLALLCVGLLGWVHWLRRRILRLEHQVTEQNRQKKSTLTLLDRIGQGLTKRLDIEPSLAIIADYIVEATQAEAGAVFTVSPDGKHLVARVVRGLFPPLRAASDYVLTKRKYLVEKVKADRIAMGEGIIGLVAEQEEPVLILDCAADPRVPKLATDFLSMNSLMAAPLRARDKTLGVFAVVNKRGLEPFNEEDMSLFKALTDQAAATVDFVALADEVAQQQRIRQELRLAREFQTMLLPRTVPEIPGFDLAASSVPANEVGGDFYDCIPLPDGKFGLAIADASGKGVPGALIMAMARSALRAESRLSDSPAETLCRVNERLYEDTKENVFLTMTYGILDPADRTFRFARAGHEPLLICDPETGEIAEKAPMGIALGMVGEEVFDLMGEERVQFKPGEIAILYTDGAVEAMDAQNEEFGHSRLHDSILKRCMGSCAEIIQGTMDDVRQFSGECLQHDDITFVVVRALPLGAEGSGQSG